MVRKYADIWVLVIIIACIKIFSLYPALVERYYSNGIYPYIAGFQRAVLGRVPFSIGDLLYGAAGVFLAYAIIKTGWSFRKKRMSRDWFRSAVLRIIRVVLVIYAWFNLSWGLNYNRLGIAHEMQLDMHEPDSIEFIKLAQDLAGRLNQLAPLAKDSINKVSHNRVLFEGAKESYAQLFHQQHFFSYGRPSIKASMYSYAGNYMGFTGYYNPFTGEAQVNTAVPYFLRPFISCHEIGHQLGYAKESEANMVAFLAASASEDPVFRYSVYFEMYAYIRPYLYQADSMMLKQVDSSLDPIVAGHFRELRKFIKDYENPVEDVIDTFYSQYLRMNEQPAGRFTYNQVILFLTGYYRKNIWP